MSDTTIELDQAEEAAFREKCRAFLEEHATGVGAGRAESTNDRGASLMAVAKKFQGALAEAGLAGLVYPAEFGGAGLTRAHDRIWREEYRRYPDMTSELTISHGMCLPVMNDFGTRRAEAPVHGRQHRRSHRVVPDVLRARRRFRRREPADQGRARR